MRDINAMPLLEPQITGGSFEKGDVVWVKTPHGRCTTKFRTGCVIVSSQYGSMAYLVMLKIYALFEDHIR